MDDLATLSPFQQYFNHIRMMDVDNKTLCATEPPFTIEKISPRAGLEIGTDRSVAALIPPNYRGSKGYVSFEFY